MSYDSGMKRTEFSSQYTRKVSSMYPPPRRGLVGTRVRVSDSRGV